MMTTTAALMAALWLATPTATPAAKLAPALGQEMAEAIVAVNKALGLESWPLHGAQPCVDRGGEGSQSKDVSPDDTRRCAGAALAKGFPELGKGYALAVLMSSGGPSTVIALGLGDASGFGAYSCDPGRKCLPTRIQTTTKWGKRLVERQQKACGTPETIWFPPDVRACPAGSPGEP
jgi:hypothetical protein